MTDLLLGYDLGSSSVKASLLDAETGKVIASATSPEVEMSIESKRHGWAEQDPELWWTNVIAATKQVLSKSGAKPESILAIGISYQMHGLVVVDKDYNVLRPAIIWCDSRAVEIGEHAKQSLGDAYCMNNLLNSPGNFTASKLRWVKDNEPFPYIKEFINTCCRAITSPCV
jgi:xylulokinase